MRGRLTIGLALLGALLAWGPQGHAARAVTDSAGRQVEVPDRIERVFPAGPPAMVFLYVLAPETALGLDAGVSRRRGGLRRRAVYRDLPVLGAITGRGGDANLEVFLQPSPT